jgi:hypothetical protein
MPTEIQQVESDLTSEDGSNLHTNLKEKSIAEGVLDLEAESSLESQRDGDQSDGLLIRAEKIELIPVEAFKTNVDGDQSPCEYMNKISDSQG